MPPLEATLSAFIVFAVSLLVLSWCSRQISIHIQIVVYHLTGSEDMANVLVFLVLLPGIILHEGSHWVVARLLGLKTSKFRVWPKRSGKYLGLGSVSIQSRDVWSDSLVGLAPLIIGSLVVAWVSLNMLGTQNVTSALGQGRWLSMFDTLQAVINQPDGLLWAYVLFTCGNAMMPSASDREPVKTILLYLSLAAVVYVILGMPTTPLQRVAASISQPLTSLSSAFFFVILIDVIVLVGLLLVEVFVTPNESSRPAR